MKYSSNSRRSQLGVDFDIEAGQSQSDIDALVARVKAAQVTHPTLRFSFTLATLGASHKGDSLSSLGDMVMKSIKAAGLGWSNVFVNLMAMDFGSSGCTHQSGSGVLCDMGQSAINAAESLHSYWGVPYSSIELTPMIGGNDVTDETSTLADAATVSAYALAKGLGGVHYWSFDRDVDCAPGWASSTCNTYGQAGVLGFANAFINALKSPTPSKASPPAPASSQSPPPSAAIKPAPSPPSPASTPSGGEWSTGHPTPLSSGSMFSDSRVPC